jgi:hypothetical protein
MNPTVSPTTKDDLTLNCQRCQHSWLRRNLETLPKACPACKSPYWQKPLTPYWAAKRQELAHKKVNHDPILEYLKYKKAARIEEQPYLKNPPKIKESTLLVYTTKDLNDFDSSNDFDIIKEAVDYWLPEIADPKPSVDQLYQAGNTIVTTRKDMALKNIEIKIKSGKLNPDDVYLIELAGHSNQLQEIFQFAKDGNIRGFWGFPWPPEPEHNMDPRKVFTSGNR